MAPHLILTVDYEVFGNGQGCVKRCVTEPAARMMRMADRFEAPITLFAETAEFMAMERELGPDAVLDVRKQLACAVRSGHDVQLHLHPQWHGATRRADGEWDLALDMWRIGDLDEEQATEIIAAGKGWLDDAAFANHSGRGCIAFRAGNWCIQPSAGVVRSLRRLGFEIESTVVPGMKRSGDGEWSDFRSVPDRPFWRVASDVCESAEEGLWEVPIASAKLPRHEQLLAELQARNTRNSRFAPDCQGAYLSDSKGPLDRVGANLRKLLDLSFAKLDFSTMPQQSLVAITEDWTRRFAGCRRPTPIVAIAHTKTWTDRSMESLESYLQWARAAGIQFSTYTEWLQSGSE
jgi:hypothetical protein